jgi:ribonuclease P protein component
VAYAIGRNVGGAVQRNRLRRRLRAVMSAQGAKLRSGTYLVGAGPGATSLSFEELKESVTRALEDEKLQTAPEGEDHS